MQKTGKEEIYESLSDIAEYFAGKEPQEVSFADADIYDYRIYLLYQKWQKESPNRAFEREFPIMDEMWELLSGWRAEQKQDLEKCQEIIKLSKKYLKNRRTFQH